MQEMLFEVKFSWGTYIMISIFISSSLFAIFDRSIFATKGKSIFFRGSVFLYSLWFFSHRVLMHFKEGESSDCSDFLLSLRSRSHFELVTVKIAFYFVAASCRRNVQSLQERCSLSFSRCSESHEFKPLWTRATDRRNKIQSQRQRFHKTHHVAQEDTKHFISAHVSASKVRKFASLSRK